VYYRIKQRNSTAAVNAWSGSKDYTFAVSENKLMPELGELESHATYSLGQNYPNPVSLETTIPFSILLSTQVKIRLFDISGKEIAKLLDEHVGGRDLSIKLNAQKYNLPPGTYVYTLEANGKMVDSKKMVIISSK
jgi:hypothetical protein